MKLWRGSSKWITSGKDSQSIQELWAYTQKVIEKTTAIR